MRINREQFNKWIKALKSGKYKQTRGTLNDNRGYCCLGVACKVIIPKNKLELTIDGKIAGDYPNCQTNAPKWLKEIDTEFNNRTKASSLSQLNDEQNISFKEIAKLLVETFPERKKRK